MTILILKTVFGLNSRYVHVVDSVFFSGDRVRRGVPTRQGVALLIRNLTTNDKNAKLSIKA